MTAPADAYATGPGDTPCNRTGHRTCPYCGDPIARRGPKGRLPKACWKRECRNKKQQAETKARGDRHVARGLTREGKPWQLPPERRPEPRLTPGLSNVAGVLCCEDCGQELRVVCPTGCEHAAHRAVVR